MSFANERGSMKGKAYSLYGKGTDMSAKHVSNRTVFNERGEGRGRWKEITASNVRPGSK